MPRGGKRPNAGRKPKADEQRIRDLVSPYRDETIGAVLKIMREGEKDSDRLAAAKLLLAYDFGTPNQHIQADVKHTEVKPPIEWFKRPEGD